MQCSDKRCLSIIYRYPVLHGDECCEFSGLAVREPPRPVFPYGFGYSTTRTSLALRPKVSGEYISSAFAGGTMKRPGVVARVT